MQVDTEEDRLSRAIKSLGPKKLTKQVEPWAWNLCCPWYGATYIIYAKEVGRLKIGCVRGNPKSSPLNVLVETSERVAELRRFNMVCGLIARFQKIYYDSPVATELLAILHGAEFVEKFLHEKYKQFNVRGEWFEAEPILSDLYSCIEIAKKNKTCVTRQLPELLTELRSAKLEDQEYSLMAKAHQEIGANGVPVWQRAQKKERKQKIKAGVDNKKLEKIKARLLVENPERYAMFIAALARNEAIPGHVLSKEKK